MNKDWLKSECTKWFDNKVNDVKKIELLRELKDEAVSRGFDRMDVSWCIHEIRKDRDANQTSGEFVNVGIPKEKPPATQEQPKETEIIDNRTEKELSKRVKQSFGEVSGLTSSGTRKSGASGGKSIVDGIL